MFTFRLKTGGFRRYDLNICNVTNFVYMTELGFCVNLDSTKEIVTFRNSFDMLVITSEPPQLDSFLNQSKAENAKGLVLVDILGTKFSKLQGYVFSSSYLKHAVTTIDIHGHYKSYNSRKRPCYPYKNGAVACRDYCFGKLIANHCKCWPVHFVAYQEAQKGMRACADMRLEQNSTPYYIPDYNLCSMDNFTYHECESHCLNDCEHVKLTFMTDVVDPIVYQNKLPFKYPNSSTLLLIKCGSFSYPQIEEVLAKSFESFMAEFGGLIGLWLGGSLIAFTHIFIFFGRMVHQWLERFKQRKADDL